MNKPNLTQLVKVMVLELVHISKSLGIPVKNPMEKNSQDSR